MPLVVISGYPCSGKTSIGKELENGLREWLEVNRKNDTTRDELKGADTEIVVVDDAIWGGDRRESFKNYTEERKMRAQFISAVERHLGRRTLVIADGLNDIKGVRYQLYCQARARVTPHCVVYVESTREDVNKVNSKRDGSERYPDDVLCRLLDRFEEPYYSNAWDSPLFFASVERKLEISKIAEHLFCRNAPKPSAANSVVQSGVDATYAQRAERLIGEVLRDIVENLAEGAPEVPYCIELPYSPVPLRFLTRIPSRAELYRSRSKFSSIIRTRKETDASTLRGSFIEFLNTYFN